MPVRQRVLEFFELNDKDLSRAGFFVDLMRLKKVCKNEPGCIVVAGRSNYSKASASLEMLLADLQAAGYAVVWFEPRITQIARWKDARLARISRGRLLAWCQSNGEVGRHVRRFVTGLILLMRPDKWIYFSQWWSSPNALAAKDLRQFLKQWPEQSVHVFAHSAGGIVSSLVANEPAVLVPKKIFGVTHRFPTHAVLVGRSVARR